MRVVDIIAAVLLVVGGLNWGLWGILEFDLVAAIAGGNTAILAKAIYVAVGLAAVHQASTLRSIQERWNVRPRLAAA